MLAKILSDVFVCLFYLFLFCLLVVLIGLIMVKTKFLSEEQIIKVISEGLIFPSTCHWD